MKPGILLKLAAGCTAFFATGHSIGHFTRHNISDLKAREVLRLMVETRFDMFGFMRTYDENYRGMSINLIITLIALTFILWTLAKHCETNVELSINILTLIMLLLLGFSITGFLFFFHVPAITCLVGAIFIGLSILQLKRRI